MIVGLDIGGANLKAATNDGRAAAMAFPLWKTPERLAEAIVQLIEPFGPPEQFAVTMTGELADCFATKAEGIARILASVQQAAGSRALSVWTTAGDFVSPDVAVQNWRSVAAANWHALATWCGRQLAPTGRGLVIDIGSTTTDIIPLHDGLPCTRGRTDLGRLMNAELIYTGVRRTPICAVTQSIILRGEPCHVAAEVFATMLDVYLILGHSAADPTDGDTADGRPATVICAENRLAHMLCCDRTELTEDEIRAVAQEISLRQIRQISLAVQHVIDHFGEPETVIISGSGVFLARQVLDGFPELATAARINLASQLTTQLAEAACAYAVASLAAKSS